MGGVVSCVTLRFSIACLNSEWYGNYLQRTFSSARQQHAGDGHRTVCDQRLGFRLSQRHGSGAAPNPDITLG